MNEGESPGSAQSSRLWVDDRYVGAHGIARYAAEVVRRLAIPWRPLPFEGRPQVTRDVLRQAPVLPRDAVVYCPGYVAFPRIRAQQVVTVHDLIHLTTNWPGRAQYLAYYNGALRPLIKRAGLVFTVSETSKGLIAEWLGDPSVEIVNAGNGCSDVFMTPGDAAASREPYALFVGNVRAHKNLDVALRSLALVPGIVLRVVLPAAEVSEARRLVEHAGVAGRVDLLVGVDDVELARLYRGAFVTLMPSLLEGFGLPALESLNCGTPVLFWAGCASVAEIVGDQGYAVGGAKDAEEWAHALLRALEEGRRVQVAPGSAYTWDSVGRAVTERLAGFLPGGMR